jgi:ABC-type sugar transport system substrate-binding protein
MPDGISKVTSAIIIAIVIIAIVGGVVYWYFSSQKPPQSTVKIGLFISNLGNPYFAILENGSMVAVNELKSKGVNIDLVVYDAKDDPTQQINQIETAIGQGFSAFIVNPTDIQAIQGENRRS